MSAFCRRKVDLPPMFGPVTSQRRSSESSTQSFATKGAPALVSAASTDGMAAAFEVEAGMVLELRPTPAAFCRTLSQRCGDVDAGQGIGCSCDKLAPSHDQVHQRLEMQSFGSERMGTGLGDAARLLVQVHGIEPHDAGRASADA